MITKLKLLLVLTSIAIGSIAHAENTSKKELLLNDQNIQSQLNSIISTKNLKCDSMNPDQISLYTRDSMVQNVQSKDNFDFEIWCKEPVLGDNVIIAFLGHFTQDELSLTTVLDQVAVMK
jgi:hypothetical protein